MANGWASRSGGTETAQGQHPESQFEGRAHCDERDRSAGEAECVENCGQQQTGDEEECSFHEVSTLSPSTVFGSILSFLVSRCLHTPTASPGTIAELRRSVHGFA